MSELEPEVRAELDWTDRLSFEVQSDGAHLECPAGDGAAFPGFCLCSHAGDRHRYGPCLVSACGCGWYRPDTRGQQGAT